MWLGAYTLGGSRKLTASNIFSKEFPTKKGKGEQGGLELGDSQEWSQLGPVTQREDTGRGFSAQRPWAGAHRPVLTET